MSKKTNKFYAYFIVDDDEKGIVHSWNECQSITKGKKCRYKSFKNESEALKWLQNGAEYENKKEKIEELHSKLNKNAIYFDAGTGRKNGVEVRLTDFYGKPLIDKVVGDDKVNEYGNYYVASNRTNNFGELVGLFAAIKYAKKNNIKTICGDSALVIDYWSKGFFNEQNLEKDTVDLIKKVSIMRKEFEFENGKIEKISGDVNPADLGFHK